MTRKPPEERPRMFVPFEFGSMLRAPFGWTNRMRREEGYPERWERRPGPRLGFWGNFGLAIAFYGSPVVGGLVGWRSGGGWVATIIGVFFGIVAELVVAIPVVLLVASWRRRKS